jgi:cytochrome P450
VKEFSVVSLGAGSGDDRSVPTVDFDHHSAYHRDHATEIYDDLRKRCPVTRTDAHGGYVVVSDYASVYEVNRDASRFSSWRDLPVGTGHFHGNVQPNNNPVRQGFIEADAPRHLQVRAPLMSKFSPNMAGLLRDEILGYTTFFIDQMIEAGEGDLVTGLTNPVPALVTMRLLGLPMKDWAKHADAIHRLVYTHPGSPDQEEVLELHHWVTEELYTLARARREEPRDDLTSYFTTLEIDGELMGIDEVVGNLQLIVAGGTDTTTTLMAQSLLLLHRDHDARAWLQEDYSRLKLACEEFLRYVTPVQGLARTVKVPSVVGGKELQLYDRLWMAWASANRDPQAFDDPGELRLDRWPNRHMSFGVGPHRCIGSNIARATFAVVIEQVLTRLGDYVVDESRTERYPSIGIINGLISMPVTFTPGPRLGSAARPY